jgi:hypothetical protein
VVARSKAKKAARCDVCDAAENVDDGLCEDCEENAVHCSVCERWYSRDGDECRHLHWTDCGYLGSGACDLDDEYVKQDFFALLDLLHRIEIRRSDSLDDYPDLITGVEVEVRENAFFTRYEGYLLSVPDLVFYRERPDLPRDNGEVQALPFARIYGGRVYDASLRNTPREDGRVEDGWGWLTSLGAGDTKEANRKTVQWIREWREVRNVPFPHLDHPCQGKLFDDGERLPLHVWRKRRCLKRSRSARR